MTIRKGQLTPDYYITCGQCEQGEHVGETILRIAKQAVGERGWAYTKERGWVCPVCAIRGTAAPLLPGTRASCRACDKLIEYVGPYWRHIGAQPRHIAEPKEENNNAK